MTEACPAGISTVAGTVPSLVSSLVKVTVRAALLSSVLRETVKVLVPPFSEMLASPAVTVRVGVSSSVMLMVSLPSANPVAAAEMLTVWSPSARASFWAVTVKMTEA